MLHVKKNRIGKIRTKRELPVKKGRFLFLPSQGCRLIINFFLFKRTKIPLLPSNHCNDQKVRTLLQGENL